MPEVSIIIVSWNAREFLIACLMSLYEDDLEGVEIIVVDNGSTDGSADAVEELFPETVLIRSDKNLGFARGNNVGIRASTGRYVCLINSDVVVLEDCINHLKDYLSSDPQAGLVCPKVLNPDMTLQPTLRRFPSLRGALLSAIGLDRKNFLPHDRTIEAEAVSGCFMMVRRDAINETGLLDERFFFYAEDKDWCKRLSNAGWKIIFYPKAQAIHYGGQSSAAAPVKFSVEMQKANLKYWNKHHGRAKTMAYIAIIIFHQLMRLSRSALVFTVMPRKRTDEAYKLKRSAACLKWLLSGKEAA